MRRRKSDAYSSTSGLVKEHPNIGSSISSSAAEERREDDDYVESRDYDDDVDN